MAKNCHSEKINWLKDTVESLQILKRPIKQPEIIEPVASLKRVTFKHSVKQKNPFDEVESLW